LINILKDIKPIYSGNRKDWGFAIIKL
jgi:hypothetical protein